MRPYTRNGRIVLNLKGSWADATHPGLLTTTRDFFDQDSFSALRSNLAAFRKAQPAACHILDTAVRAQRGLSTQERKTLESALKDTDLGQDWNRSERAVMAVCGWTRKHGDAIPESLLDIEGRPVLPDELAVDRQRLETLQSRNPEQAALVTAFLAGVQGKGAQGSTHDSPPIDRQTRDALRGMGFIDRMDRLSLHAKAIAQGMKSGQ